MKNIILFGFVLFAYACTENATLPKVTTLPVTEVTSYYAITGGNVIDDGGSAVIARGVCASEDSNYLTSLNDYGIWYTIDSSGLGSYTSQIALKWHGAAYTIRSTHYIRAYATNSEGTAFGEIVTAYPADKPLSDNSIDIVSFDVARNSITIDYTFYYQIMSTVREMGICYSTQSEPTIDDNYVIISDIDEGDNALTIQNLIANTKYYIRSYDKNQSGVYYSSIKSFTTLN